MRRLSDRFAEAAQSCADLRQLCALVRDAAAELGFEYFALLDHASLAARGAGLVRIDNYPDAWVRELLQSGDAADDPVHLASRRANMGFGWCKLGSLIRLDRRHRQIMARSRYFGLGAGFTVPANVPGEPSASCSFAVRTGAELPTARLRCTELIGAHALCAARRLRPLRARRTRPRLSRREVQCLRLVAIGKTDGEIATILGLGTETARQYVKRARAAYDVVSRTQLVVHGLRDAWISFEEAIPADGGMG
ncbi:MAG TPA: LuxR family transcriptional regulator [Sphingomicrobium sp.]|nr:LuxR family transcriptional regulator [Sphingomicrobium sp.]